jgi:uncharacterized membrane protein
MAEKSQKIEVTQLPSLRNTQYDRFGRTTIRLARTLSLPLILLLAAVLRLYQLSGQSLWSDEGNSVALARDGFAEIAQRTAFDIHPPFYYWLLKIWVAIFGDSEIGLRSLSAVLGVGLVYLIWVLGIRLFNRRVGLMAAFIAALSPLQVYYSQEARMYMLLAFLSTLTVLAMLFLLESYALKNNSEFRIANYAPRLAWPSLLYLLTVTAGLYTHYAFPLILLAVNLTILAWFQRVRSKIPNPKSQIFHWIMLQLIPLLFYLPWLPTAWRQITTWPTERITLSLRAILNTVSSTLLFGLSWPYDWGLLPTIGLGLALLIILWLTLYKSRLTHHTSRTLHPDSSIPARHLYLALLLLYLWFLLPVMLTIIVFSPAFLKFLLVATPPLALLLTLLIELLALLSGRRQLFSAKATNYKIGNSSHRNVVGYLIGGTLLVTLSTTSAISLYHYYTNPAYARDDYRSIVNFIKAVGDPTDAVILNAEGQQDVFDYYFERDPVTSMPVYPLPRQRPLNETATLDELQTIAPKADGIYAVYWATQQADPNGLIEGWLDTHLYKATDQWYGNVRLVSYASPQTSMQDHPISVDYQLGAHIRLTGYALSAPQIMPGDILQLALTWETDNPLPAEDYTVFVQVLDATNHLVGQRDAPPLTPTSAWPVNEPVPDAHGIFIEPGTPPGKHRLILGLYNRETGQRLPVSEGPEGQTKDFIELTEVGIIRPAAPLPLEAFKIQVPLNISMGEVPLLGYDLYKLGHRSTPNTPLHPGDPVHLVAYWMSSQPGQGLVDQLSVQVVTNRGEATPLSFTYPVAGVDYPMEEWLSGEIIRAQYDFFLSNLEPGIYRLRLSLETDGSTNRSTVVTSKPFRVE